MIWHCSRIVFVRELLLVVLGACSLLELSIRKVISKSFRARLFLEKVTHGQPDMDEFLTSFISHLPLLKKETDMFFLSECCSDLRIDGFSASD